MRALFLTLLVVPLLAPRPACQQANDDAAPVSRAEYERLKAEVDSLAKQLPPLSNGTDASHPAGDDAGGDLRRDVEELKARVKDSNAGSTEFLFSGFAVASFVDQQRTNNNFSGAFYPTFTWKLSDRLFVEAQAELSAGEGTGSEATLVYAEISYLLNDYVTLAGGKFLTPFGQFSERLYPAWINKLPDAPLVYNEDDGLTPFTSIGVQARGGVPVGSDMKGNYALYVVNGPSVDTGATDPTAAGKLDYGDGADTNTHKSVGGRVGFLPFPELEVGISMQYGRVDPDGSGLGTVDAWLQGFDASWSKDSTSLGGKLDLRGEWVYSKLSTTTYDPTGGLGFGPVSYSNKRTGAYLQAAYRPTHSDKDWLKDLEGVIRFDTLNTPSGAPGSFDEKAFTFGVDYWVSPSAVAKLALRLDDRTRGADNASAVLLQFAVGL
jgi:hypothetical protein